MNPRFLLLLFSLLAGCTTAAVPEGTNLPVSPTATRTENLGLDTSTPEATSEPEKRNRRVVMDDQYTFALSLGFDRIQPIYSPQFAPAEEAPLDDHELVLGIAWEGEAKAYPISVLRYREMVDDKLAGIPTLVTW